MVKYRSNYILVTRGERLEHRKREINKRDSLTDPELLENKHDIAISDVAFNEVLEVGELVSNAFQIVHQGHERTIQTLQEITINFSPPKVFRVFPTRIWSDGNSAPVQGRLRLPIQLPPRAQLDCTIQCSPPCIGVTHALIVFNFGDFRIGKKVTMLDTLKASQPYLKPNTRDLRHREDVSIIDLVFLYAFNKQYDYQESSKVEIIAGEKPRRPVSTAAGDEYNGPKEYKLSNSLKQDCALGLVDKDIQRKRESLSFGTYKDFYQLLLWVEEIQMNKDIRAYNMEGVQMSHGVDRDFLSLEVPGLAEKRPSVLVGDSVFVSKVGSSDMKLYEGYAHHIRDISVELKFDNTFHRQFVREQRFNVQFTFSRKLLRVFHQGLENLTKRDKSLLTNWLFPRAESFALQDPLVSLIGSIRL